MEAGKTMKHEPMIDAELAKLDRVTGERDALRKLQADGAQT